MARKKKGPTLAEQRYNREAAQHATIDAAARFAGETGVCPVCRTRPSAHGITCGELACIERWLIPVSSGGRIQVIVDSVMVIGDGDELAPQEKMSMLGTVDEQAPAVRALDSYRKFGEARAYALGTIDTLPWETARSVLVMFYRRFGSIPLTDDALKLQAHQERVRLAKIMPEQAATSARWLAERGMGV